MKWFEWWRKRERMAPILMVNFKRGDFSRISERTGRSVNHVKAVLDARRTPSRELAEAIARYYGTDIKTIFPDLPDRDQEPK